MPNTQASDLHAHPRPLTITLDLEDHRPHADGPARYREITERFLALLAGYRIQATIFVVGNLIETDAALLRKIADAGHELGLHSYNHDPITAADPDDFREQTYRAKTSLEDLTGTAVIGYRAPSFSLTRKSQWCTGILSELGFHYSSSVLPAGNPLYGYPGAPATPFKWPSGLLELPVPLAHIGPLTVPYLGGIYFRYLPLALIRRAQRRSAEDSCSWFYAHPYDFDPDEPFTRPHNAPLWMSLLLWFNRRGAMAKLERLLSSPDIPIAPSFAARITAGEFVDVPTKDSDHHA